MKMCQRNRTLVLAVTAAVIILLVVFIVVLWVLQGSGAFDSPSSSSQQRDNGTFDNRMATGDDGGEDAASKNWIFNESGYGK